MDINAKFSADFTEFNTGVTVAEDKLKGIEGEASKTADALGKVPTALATTNTAAREGASGVTQLGQALGTVDKTLGLAGVNIGKEIGALKELGTVAGKTATELGLIATAGAVVGTALASWNVGRAVAGFFDLDKKIGDATARLLGFGDVAAQVAGAQMDELMRASLRAGRAVTDLAEARAINAGAVAKDMKAAKEAREEYDKWAEATKRITDLAWDWQKTLQTINPVSAEAAKSMLALGASVTDVAASTGLSVRQVNALVASMDALKVKADEYAATIKKVQEVEKNQLDTRLTGLLGLSATEQRLSQERLDRMKKEIEAGQARIDAAGKAAEQANAGRGAQPVADPILAAALRRDEVVLQGQADLAKFPEKLAQITAAMQRAADEFQDAVDASVRDKTGPTAAARPVEINVSGVLDPRTIRDLAAAVSDELMRNTGRLYPSR
jgi:hypothetical protein